ncbi:MAG: UDP-N-acetylglucosamine 2-epimerase (non-hydrolyzing) [Patescibacteria group bacterium]|jgi:UDP-N-acetylglucosamine 2-epimerase (non-hydrolysing)
MKVLTLMGTRPEIIRLSRIITKLDSVCTQITIYTNQNFDPNLSTIFLKDLGIRTPDYMFPKTNGLGDFIGNAFLHFDKIIDEEKPDKVLVLGDTNSGLLAILAAKKGIPVYHMEAGNRCYDGEVPEETNRKVIDSCSLYNLPYTENSKQNLINERFHKNFVFKIGNPIWEVLCYYQKQIDDSDILMRLGIMPYTWDRGIANPYALLSYHRTENVDNREKSKQVVEAINEIAEDLPVIYSFHPRTKDQFAKHGIKFSDKVILTDPIGFFDFVYLEKHAKVILTDSGTVPEETSLFGKPCIVLRNTTERQELMECGSLILAGTKKEDILRAYHSIGEIKQSWSIDNDYFKLNVSDTVIRLLMGQ